MPVMDGLRFLRALREESHIDIPVIVLTCLEARSFTVEALVVGANEVLTKPVDLEVLLEKLKMMSRVGAA